MGSDSDWPVMEAAVAALDELGVACEVDVVSAHRMPEEMVDYGRRAEERGLRVIVAGAGGAAHLPGMLASVTSLPVIGVPVPLKYLDGMDSLLSIVQMPAGVPVATVSVGGARNAGLLAARILGAGEGAEAAGCAARWRSSAARLRDEAHAKGRRCASGAPGADGIRLEAGVVAGRAGSPAEGEGPGSGGGWGSALHALGAAPWPLVLGAGVHDDVEARRPGPLGRRLVDHALLHPDGVDLQAVLVRDRVVHHRADVLRVDEAVDDLDVLVGDVGDRRVALAPCTVSALGCTGMIGLPSSTCSHCEMPVGGARPVLATGPRRPRRPGP